MKHTHNWKLLGLALCASAFLMACGGGGGGSDPQTADGGNTTGPVSPPLFGDSDVPVAATQDVQAAMAFVRTVAEDPVADKDGLRVDAAELATTDAEDADPGV